MSQTKTGRNDPCPCGSGRKYKHCCWSQERAPARPAVQKVNTPSASDINRHLMQGFALYEAKRYDEMDALCAGILKLQPRQPDALHLLGLSSFGRGQNEQALALIDRAMKINAIPSMHNNRGLVLRAMGRPAEAAQSFRQALSREPNSALFHANLGAALQQLGRWDEALDVFRRAAALAPTFVDPFNGMSTCSFMIGDLSAMEEYTRAALALDPHNPMALMNNGIVAYSRGDLAASLASLDESLRIAPDNADALYNRGETLWKMSRLSESFEAFERCYRIRPTAELLARRKLMLPHINESREQIAADRVRFETALDEMIRDGVRFAEPASMAFCTSVFLLAFHGENDLRLMKKLAGFYLHACPQLSYRAPHVDAPRNDRGVVRIGFFSTFINLHSVARCFAGILSQMARDSRFEVVLLSTSNPVGDAETNPYAEFTGTMVKVGRRFADACQAIEREKLDVLVYQDIGMDALGYFLAFARLARIQCVMGGHPVTTGIPNMDYFISSSLIEPPQAQDHYSESLLLMSGLPVAYQHPDVPPSLRGRAEMGLPESGAIYLCPMMLQKIHPDFDQALSGILAADPTGHIILFEHAGAKWEDMLRARFERTIAKELRERVIFHPWLHEYRDFISVNALADVVIDPFHFGIGSTVIATFAVGTPIVTCPSSYMRGRVGLSLCKVMNLPECVTNDLQSYVNTAVRIANDTELQQSLRHRILENKSRLFDNQSWTEETIELLFGLATVEVPQEADAP